MSTPAPRTATGLDLAALDAITDAVESGAGLPEVVRAAARALDAEPGADRPRGRRARRGGALAGRRARRCSATRAGVEAHRAARRRRAGRARCGCARARRRAGAGAAAARHDARSPPRSSACARPSARPSRRSPSFLHALLDRDISGREDIRRRAPAELGIDLVEGASIVVARAHSHVPTEDGWRAARARRRRSRRARRACRARSPRSPRVPTPRAPRSCVLLPGADDALAARAADGVLRELQARAARPHASRSGAAAPRRPGRPASRAATRRCWPPTSSRATPSRPVLAFEETGRLPAAAVGDERGPGRAAALLRRDRRAARRLRRAVRDRPRADGRGVPRRRRQRRRAPRSGSSPTATRSATGSSACGSSRGSTSARPTGARSSRSGSRRCGCSASPHRGGPATEAGAGGGRVPRRG